MSETRTCHVCGTPLGPEVLASICLACRLRTWRTGEAAPGARSLQTAETPPSRELSTPSALATRLSPIEIQALPAFTPPEPEEIAPYFPQLEILDLIGRGGMGVVYKARQKELDRLVALKVLLPEASADPTFGERFHREARALARLSHPNIVAVHDIGRSAGLCYLVLEFVDGPNLRQLLQAEELDHAQGLAIVVQLCDALQYAHDERVVHRDVKPDNILISYRLSATGHRLPATGQDSRQQDASSSMATADGRQPIVDGRLPMAVKIADFGIAKLAGRTPNDVALTASRQVMGTLFYMAPEQFEHPRAVDHRADIYSVGVVLYELLTGELPMGRFAPPSQKALVDPRLDRIVMQALEKQPERRYQRALDLKKDLEACLHGPAAAVADTRTSPPPLAPQAEPDGVTPARLVRGPAIALLIAGGLTTLGLVVFAGMLLGFGLSEALAGRAGVVARFWERGWIMVAGTLAGPYLLAAARRMERLRSYRTVLLASHLALLVTVALPSPFNLLCLPVGVWCICTLWRRDVRAAFQPQPQLDKLERGLIVLTALCIAMITCIVALFVGHG